MEARAPRGTTDILPEEARLWQKIEATVREVMRAYGYGEIRTPVFEYTELFLRGVGETTDIVEKQMYTFEDQGGRSLTLRPEGTAPVVRAFVQHRLDGRALPQKLWYAQPMFRYERPQAGTGTPISPVWGRGHRHARSRLRRGDDRDPAGDLPPLRDPAV